MGMSVPAALTVGGVFTPPSVSGMAGATARKQPIIATLIERSATGGPKRSRLLRMDGRFGARR